MPENYASNSHKHKAEEAAKKTAEPEKKEIKKIASGVAKTKKRSVLKDTFISDDASNVGSYVIFDIIVPAIKNSLVDVICNSARMIFGSGTDTGRSRGYRSSVDYVSYNKYSSRDSRPRDDRYTSRDHRQMFDDIIVPSRRAAEEVLDEMDNIIDHYGIVKVSDLYDIVDIPIPYTANKYGWSNIRNAEIIEVKDGFWIRMPKAMPL